MKPLGGYFELDSGTSKNKRHRSCYFLNTGRNCLELVLQELSPAKLWIPNYTCHVLKEPLDILGLPFSTYSIDHEFFPDLPKKIPQGQYILYANYFGICSKQVSELVSRYSDQLIVDNAQAYYDPHCGGVATFYSPRKFFGIPDGGVLHFSKKVDITLLPLDKSGNRLSHLIMRLESGPQAGYKEFVKNDKSLTGQPLKRMSKLTELLLTQADTEEKRNKRINNFRHLHQRYKAINEIKIDENFMIAPLCYPLLLNDGKALKKYLINHKIFVPTYWPEVFGQDELNEFERYLINDLVCLPVDHRYFIDDMDMIINTIENFESQ